MKDTITTKSIEKGIEFLQKHHVEPKYIHISHIYRDTLKKTNQLEEISKLEKAWGVEIVFT